MGVEHFEPKSISESLARTYTNLLYACNDCNRYRQRESLPINPITTPLAEHLQIDSDGKITAKTADGQDFIDLFDLAAPNRDAMREDKLKVLRIKRQYPDDPDIDAIYRRAFGYPALLPDLGSLAPPAGNSKSGSENQSHFARRQRDELPEVY